MKNNRKCKTQLSTKVGITNISKHKYQKFLHGGTTPWSAVGISASTHFQPRPIPGWEKKKRRENELGEF